MCRRINCRSCGKPTWTGCGTHISIVLAGVKEEDRCKCRSVKKTGQTASNNRIQNSACIGPQCRPGQANRGYGGYSGYGRK